MPSEAEHREQARFDAVKAERDANLKDYLIVANERDALRAENERLRAALREALEKATACAPADRLHELEPLWSVLDQT